MHFLEKSAQKSGLEKVRKNLFGAERFTQCAAHFVKALRDLCRLGKSYKKTKRYRNIFLFYKMFCSKWCFLAPRLKVRVFPHQIRVVLNILSLEMSVELRLEGFEASFREKISRYI